MINFKLNLKGGGIFFILCYFGMRDFKYGLIYVDDLIILLINMRSKKLFFW